MHTSDTPPVPHRTTTCRGGFSLLAMAVLLSGCMEPYRSVDSSLDIDYDEHEFLSLITIETGDRTWTPIGDRIAHGTPHREYKNRQYESLVARWSATDGRLVSIEPFTRTASTRGRLRVGADGLILLDQQVFRHIQCTWIQVNAGREYSTWSGSSQLRECFTPDHRRHLFGDGQQVQIRNTATGDIHWSQPVNEAWIRFASQAGRHHLSKWTLDSAGRHVLCVVYDDPKHQARVLVYDMQNGSFREVLIGPDLLTNERRADLTVVAATDVVAGKVQFLIESSEPISTRPASMIRLRLITEDRRVLYDNAWRHEHQTEIRWRPAQSLLLMSDTGEGGLDSKQTRITRIDYGNDRETTFLIAYPSEDEVMRRRTAR